MRNGGDFSRADFSLALQLLRFMDIWEATRTLKDISLSFRPSNRRNKSSHYWEHTVSKAAEKFREWEASYSRSRRYREPEPSYEQEENSPAWREPGR